jgi:hypothetical protein
MVDCDFNGTENAESGDAAWSRTILKAQSLANSPKI